MISCRRKRFCCPIAVLSLLFPNIPVSFLSLHESGLELGGWGLRAEEGKKGKYGRNRASVVWRTGPRTLSSRRPWEKTGKRAEASKWEGMVDVGPDAQTAKPQWWKPEDRFKVEIQFKHKKTFNRTANTQWVRNDKKHVKHMSISVWHARLGSFFLLFIALRCQASPKVGK